MFSVVKKITEKDEVLLKGIGFTHTVKDTWYKEYVLDNGVVFQIILNPRVNKGNTANNAVIGFQMETTADCDSDVYVDEIIDMAYIYEDLSMLIVNGFIEVKYETGDRIGGYLVQ